MNRILSMIESIAGLALAAVAALIFLTSVLRFGFSINLPDSFDFARYLQGIAIFWGLSVATWRGSHISIDIVWEISTLRARRAINIFAALVTSAFFCVFAAALLTRLPLLIASNEVTADMRIVVWPFFLAAACGVLATLLISILVILRSFNPARGLRHG